MSESGPIDIPFETTLDDQGLMVGLDKIPSAIQDIATVLGELSDKATASFTAIQGGFDRLSASLDEIAGVTSDTLPAMAASLDDIATAAGAAALGLDETAAAADRAAGTSGLAAFSEGLSGAIDHLAASAFGLGINATLLDSFGLAALRNGASFQQQMKLVSSLAANGQDNIAQLTTTLINSAGPWGQAPADLANGLYYVMSAGYHGATALDILKESAYAASGGLGSIQDMAKGVTTLMTDFGLSSKTAADIVVTAVTEGKVSVDEFVNSIGKWGPTAQQTGYDVLAASTAFDTLTRSGISANSAGTYLRSTMLQIGDRALTLQQQAQALGFSLSATTLEMMKQSGGANALRDQLKYIEDAAHKWAYTNWSGAEAATHYDFAIQKLFGGIRSGQGALGLSINDFTNLDSILTDTKNNLSQTTAEDHYKQVMQGLSGALIQLKGSFSGLSAEFVTAFGPELTVLIRDLAGAMEKLTATMEAHPKAVQAIGAALLGLVGILNGAAIVAMGAWLAKSLGVKDVLEALSGKNEELTKSLGKLGGTFTDVTTKGGELGRALGEGPARGIKGLVDGFTHLGDLGTKIPASFEVVRGALGNLGSALGDGMLKVSDFATNLSFKGVLESVTGGLKNLAMGGIGALQDAIVGGLPALGALAGSIGAVAFPLLLIAGLIAIAVLAFTQFHTQTMQVIGVLGTQVKPILDDVGKMFGAFLGQIKGAWEEHGPAITAAMDKLFAALRSMQPTIEVVGTVLKVVFGVILTVLGGLVSGFISALPSIIGFFSAIFGIVNDVSRLIIAVFTGDWSKIPSIIGDLFGHVKDLITNALGAILSFIGGFVNGALGLIDKFTGGFLQKIGLLPKEGPIHVAEMKVKSLTHLEEMQTQGIAHLETMRDGIVKAIENTKDPATKHMLEMKLAVIDHTLKMKEESVKHTDEARKKMLEHLEDLKKNGIQKALDFAGGVVGGIFSFFESLPIRAEKMWTLFQMAIQHEIDKVKKTIDDWIFNAKQSLNNMVTDLTTIGTNLIQGLLNGITGMEKSVKDEIDKIGNLIPSGLKHLFGISSPSAVFAEIGANLGEGLMQGLIGSNLPERVAAHLAGITGNATAQVTANVSGGGGPALVGVNAMTNSYTAADLVGAGGGGGGFAGAGGPVQVTVNMNLQGDVAAGWRLLGTSQVQEIAHRLSEEMGKMSWAQTIMPNGYAGFG